MTPEIERLLGGYATNTLTSEERKLLYEAALEDQDLFNALEDEQALRDLLTDEESRREVVRALRPEPRRTSRRWIWGLSGSLAAAAVLLLVLIPRNPSKPEMTVALSTPGPSLEIASPAAPASVPAPLPVPLKKQKAIPPPAQTTLGSLAAPRGMAVSSGDQFAPAAGLVRQETVTGPGPFLILQTGDSLEVKLRPTLPGHLAISELSPDATWKTLPTDAPIQVDRQKTIRIEWLNPPADAQTNYLTLSPGKPPVGPVPATSSPLRKY